MRVELAKFMNQTESCLANVKETHGAKQNGRPLAEGPVINVQYFLLFGNYLDI